jgi:glycine C-acetyltransferase
MPHERLAEVFARRLGALAAAGTVKRHERVITSVLPAEHGRGPRFLLEGYGQKPFLRMNANSYLGLSFERRLIAAEEVAVRKFGAGPGAVRFISGTWQPHVALERTLARFHGREAAMIFSSAYATMVGLLPPLITPETGVISDELNHNCIINAIRLSSAKEKRIYRHLDLDELEDHLKELSGTCRRAIIVTDGVFSMRGDYAPLDRICELAERFDPAFLENVLVIADDSHGVGAFGASGRGTEEVTQSGPVDLLVGTLGKALGVNGGYVFGSKVVIDYLRETAPFYIYSNPITPGEAAAATAAVGILDSTEGRTLLDHLQRMKARFENGLTELGLETIPGIHPVTPVMIRDTAKTRQVVESLFERGVLATGLGYPVVPSGDDEIRFQICADHTPGDIDEALAALAAALA